jgi:hypothetical protein
LGFGCGWDGYAGDASFGRDAVRSHGDGVQAWKIAANGSLETLPGVEGVRANTLHVTADGKSLLALSSDAVLRVKIDAATPVLAAPVKVASLSKPVSIAIW